MLTRRMFGSLLAGSSAAIASIGSGAKAFVEHKVLRRPYRVVQPVGAMPYWLYDAVFITLAECHAPLKVTAIQDGNPEPLLQTTVVPRAGERFMLLGLHQCRAERPVRVILESGKPFTVKDSDFRFMRPSFRRENNMIHFHDTFYKPLPEERGFYGANAHHRVMFGPGKDVGYTRS